MAANRVVHPQVDARPASRATPARPSRSAPSAGRPGDPGITNLTEVELVRSGSGSSLYQGMQISPRRPVAVKVLHDELTSPAGERFDRERAVLGQLSGQTAVVPLFETGVTAAGDPYLLQAWYGRGSLARLVAEHGALSWQEAAFLVEPVAVALAEIHSQGLVHRDLRPENVLLTDFLLPRVANFGLTLPVGACSTEATIAPAPFFSPPELAEPAEVDPRADVYGLGALLWALLTGQVAFDGVGGVRARTATAQARTGRWDPPTTDTPLPLLDLIARSMADDPDERPMSAAAFVTELRRAVAPLPFDDDAAPADPTAYARAIDLRSGQLSVATAISASHTRPVPPGTDLRSTRAPVPASADSPDAADDAGHPTGGFALDGPGPGSSYGFTGTVDQPDDHPWETGRLPDGGYADASYDGSLLDDGFGAAPYAPADPGAGPADGYGVDRFLAAGGFDEPEEPTAPGARAAAEAARARTAPWGDELDLPPTGTVAERRPGPGAPPAPTSAPHPGLPAPARPAGRTKVRLTAGGDEVKIGPADARYVLALVACIVAAVVLMLAVAILGAG